MSRLAGGAMRPFGQLDAIIDRRHRAAAEDLAGAELGRPDRRGEFLEERLAVGSEPEQQVGHEDRHEPREALPEIGVHLLEVAVALPQRIGGFDQSRAELLAEDRLDLGRRGGGDRLGGLVAGADQHRLADDPDAHALERRPTAWRGSHRASPAPRSAARSYRGRAGRNSRARGSFSASSTLAASPIVRARMPLRSQ